MQILLILNKQEKKINFFSLVLIEPNLDFVLNSMDFVTEKQYIICFMLTSFVLIVMLGSKCSLIFVKFVKI